MKHSPFQMHPEVLNRVNIRRLDRPDKHLDVIVLKPLCCLFRGVFGVMSCWNIHSSSATSNFSKLSTTPSSKVSQYCCESMIPCISVSFPTPFHPIHPHAIRLFPPPCLTVGVVVLSENGSLFC